MIHEKEVECYICKKIWNQKEVGSWAYHRSIPDPTKVVCLRHPGVEEWYNKLLKDALDTGL